MKRWHWALLALGFVIATLGVATLIGEGIYTGSKASIAANASTGAAASSSAAAASAAKAASAAQNTATANQILLRQVQDQGADIKALVATALRDQAAAAKSQAQGTAYLIQVDRTLNAICIVDRCGAPLLPTTIPAAIPASAGRTAPTKKAVVPPTIPPPRRRRHHKTLHR